MKPTDKYDKVNWAELVEYSESSPSCLVWKVKRGTKIKPGMRVGHVQRIKNRTYAYWTFRHGPLLYNVHRVIYKLMKSDYIPEYIVDHRDRNALNNRLENLRMIPSVKNSRNRSKSPLNTSGVTGVSRVKSRNSYKWVANITLSGKQKTKSFSVQKYGEDEARRLATEWRIHALNTAITSHGFTETHGSG